MSVRTWLLGKSVGRDLVGFAGIQVAVSLAYFLVLPVVASVSSRSQWAAVAIGMSVGILGSYAVDCGWSLTGPAMVAAAGPAGSRALYAASLRSRLLMSVVVLPVSAGLAWVLAPSPDRTVSLLMALAMALGGLSPSWLAIGLRRPGLLMAFEAGPRLVAAASASALVLLGAAVEVFPLLMIASTVLGYAAVSVRLLRPDPGPGADVEGSRDDSAWGLVRGNLGATVTVLAAGAYANATTVLAALVVSPDGVALYSSGERLYKLGLLAIIATASALQGWVFDGAGRPDVARMRRALVGHLLIGAVGALVLAVAIRPATTLLFGEALQTSWPVALWLALAFLAISLNSSLGRHTLIPLGRTSAVSVSTISGAVVGVPMILVLGRVWGPSGVAAGFALSEVLVTLVQARYVVVERLLARPPLSVGRGRGDGPPGPSGRTTSDPAGRAGPT